MEHIAFMTYSFYFVLSVTVIALVCCLLKLKNFNKSMDDEVRFFQTNSLAIIASAFSSIFVMINRMSSNYVAFPHVLESFVLLSFGFIFGLKIWAITRPIKTSNPHPHE